MAEQEYLSRARWLLRGGLLTRPRAYFVAQTARRHLERLTGCLAEGEVAPLLVEQRLVDDEWRDVTA